MTGHANEQTERWFPKEVERGVMREGVGVLRAAVEAEVEVELK